MAKEGPLWEKPFLRKRANWFVPAGLNFPAYPPYALLPEGKDKRAKGSGKRLEPATRKRKEKSEGVRRNPPPKGPPPEGGSKSKRREEEKPVSQEVRGREKNLLMEKKRNKSC